MKTLQCSCCGARTKGKQHWNQDTGYGLCPKCAAWIATRNDGRYADDLKAYGTPGLNYAAPLAAGCTPGMLVAWKTLDDNWHIGILKEWDNGTAIISEINELDERHTVAIRN